MLESKRSDANQDWSDEIVARRMTIRIFRETPKEGKRK
jgi:hypothetical protein